jgi:TatD DNase family protein
MKIFDAHCHLAAIASEVPNYPLAVAAISLDDYSALVKLRQLHPQLKIGIGLHPWLVTPEFAGAQLREQLLNLISSDRPDFIGETGLDKLRPNFELQQHVLALQLTLAQEFELPVVLHCVRAYNELLSLLASHPICSGLVHAFNSTSQMAAQLQQHKCRVGVGSLVLNQKSIVRKALDQISVEQIVIESDAPYMPAAGKASSSYTDCISYAQEVATIKHLDLEQLASIANHNFTQLFGSS